jgi:uncharacterized protein YdiU (UPF0061 family)
MHALGVPTTRALSAATTGEPVLREEGLLPGGVLIRVAASHVRIGTFEFFASRGDVDAVRTLADYAMARHYPGLASAPDRYFRLLESVVDRQCALVARWMQVGFIHGVMNTDNMTVSGETIDFGPCAFMDEYDPATVFSFIDRRGRYAYANQPVILQWNLARLAEALLPLLDADQGVAIERATAVVHSIPERHAEYWLQGLRQKLGLQTIEATDQDLAQSLLLVMQAERADFTNTFRSFAAAATDPDVLPAAFTEWRQSWLARLAREPGGIGAAVMQLRRSNPAYIPRNHRIEAVISAAVARSDFAPFHALHALLSHPFADQPGRDDYREPPLPQERVRNTFCGT